MDAFTLAVLIIVIALVFDYINGFHDAANSIATVVATRVLTPFQAVVWAAFFNPTRSASILARKSPFLATSAIGSSMPLKTSIAWSRSNRIEFSTLGESDATTWAKPPCAKIAFTPSRLPAASCCPRRNPDASVSV